MTLSFRSRGNGLVLKKGRPEGVAQVEGTGEEAGRGA